MGSVARRGAGYCRSSVLEKVAVINSGCGSSLEALELEADDV